MNTVSLRDFITLTCPSCGAALDITPHSPRAVCAYCGNTHLVRNLIPVAPPAAAPAAPSRGKMFIPRPEALHIQGGRSSVRITRKWFSYKYLPMLFFCCLWDGFLVFWYGIAFAAGAPLIFKIFPVFHVLIGVWLTYTTLAGLINRTYLDLDANELAVWHEPLPWSGEITLPIREVKQLFVKQTTKKVKSEHESGLQYELHAVMQTGETKMVLGELDSPEIPLYLEQQMEKWLRLTDRPVAGEMAR